MRKHTNPLEGDGFIDKIYQLLWIKDPLFQAGK
jgi:hypothetical protein